MGEVSVRKVLKDRWLGLCLGLWMQACGGISYVFSLYSADLKRTMGYNQEMIDGLGTAKDIGGNVGIISGLLIDVTSAWFVLLVGGCMHFLFYTLLYLAATGQILPSHWQMCIIIMLGTNGATWFNTAVLVTCMRNFPSDRGVVVGLLKGFIGLSGAIFTQVYTAVYAPNTGPFLLFCASVPPLVAFVSMLIIQPVEAPKQKDESDKLKFKILYFVGLVLAFYLMAVILIQDFLVVSKGVSGFFMAVMLVILLLPGVIPWRWGRGQQLRGYHKLAVDVPMSYSPSTVHTPTKHHHLEPLLVSKTSTAIDVANKIHDVQNGAIKAGLPDTPSKLKTRLGQDHTLFQAVNTQDYWLLFFAMGCGTGSGLTAINNLAQMAESLGSRSIGAFVALVSVWNFLGRMGSGYLSEHYMKRHATPRPLFLLVVQLVMASAHLLFASSVPTLLYLASVLVGLAHGAHWTLMVATSSELFGLQNFGALYNTLSISSTIGSYILSVKLAGYLYDRQVAAAEALALAAGQGASSSHKCAGPECFRSTFLVMACVCGVGCIALLRLVGRTKKVYRDMYKQQQAKDALKENEESLDATSPLLPKDSSNGEAIRTDSPIYKASTLSDAHLRHHAPVRTD
ncbi:hypothetical protein Mapa_003471 [Marchantia paleacea]|nr:hypothetical protein Mapa_003471 [Marchantia paleacea]